MSTTSLRNSEWAITKGRRLLPTFLEAGRPRLPSFNYRLSFLLFCWTLLGLFTPLRPFDRPNSIPLPTVGVPNGAITLYVQLQLLSASNELMIPAVYEDGSPPPNQDLNRAIFALLILGGHICFPVMLLCIFISRRPLSRSRLFLHFCFTWVLHAVGFSIL